jgi:predicted TIM-barrel fold metal-dependent hydrolase
MHSASRPPLSRRAFVGGLASGAILGVGVWESARWAIGSLLDAAPEAARPPALRAIIDVHTHPIATLLEGVPAKRLPGGEAYPERTEEVARLLRAEMTSAGVTHTLGMPRRSKDEADPLGVAALRQLARLVPGLHPVGFADPERTEARHLARVEEELQTGDIRALKAYLGYIPRGAGDPGYHPYYRLAAKYRIPVILHTGDTFSQNSRLKFAHPLTIDDVAVDFPQTNFVLAHLGNPWMMDAAQVVYKNNKKGLRENVHVDLSGILVGSARDFEGYRGEGVLKQVGADIRKALDYAERPEAFLYGSDWPLVPMAVYRDFLREVIHADLHQAIFHDNAQALFRLP